MQSHLIMTVLGNDRPGLVNSLAETIARHHGNWLESRMARLDGQFAGIIRISCPSGSVDALLHELQSPSAPGTPPLSVTVVRDHISSLPQRRIIAVDVVGQDRPGIVRELTAAIASVGANIEELTTGLESAPMSGSPMFRASGTVSIQADSDPSSLVQAIEGLGGDLTVDVSLNPAV
jgi:glycine cleavage system regulatory protein